MDKHEITARIKRKGLRLRDVALRAEVSDGYLSKILEGFVTKTPLVLRVQLVVAEILELSVEEIFPEKLKVG